MSKHEWKSVSKFLGQYGSIATKRTYMTGISVFFKTLDPKVKDVDTYSLSYLKTHTENQIEDDIIKFRDALLKRPAKTRQLYLKAIFGFLDSNDINFKRAWKNNILGKDSTAVSEERIPTSQEIERILSFQPLMGRAITLCLASSGLRIGELLQLRLENVNFDNNPVLISVQAPTTKTKQKRLTFFSQEAVKELKEWLAYKPEWIRITENRMRKPIENKERIFPISDNAYREIWDSSISKAKLAKKDITTNRQEVRIHSLRKFFRTNALWAVPDVGEALLGHLGGLEEVYVRFTKEQLEQNYLQVEPNLTIIGSPPNLAELEAKVEERYQGIDRVIANLSIENQKLQESSQKKDIEFQQKLDATMKPVLKRMGELEELYKWKEEMTGLLGELKGLGIIPKATKAQTKAHVKNESE